MRVELEPLFGEVPTNADNLEIVGVYQQRFEEKSWATVWPGSGVIRWADGSIETETIWQDEHLKQCGDFHSQWSWFPRTQRGRYFNLSLFWSPGYYHWICDVLTRLHTVLPRLSPDVQVILPPRMSSWQSRSLELIGLPQSQWLPYTGKRPWKVEHLFYASPVSMTGDHEEKSLCWVRDTIWRRCLGEPPLRPGWRKLYLTRKHTRSRNLVNEPELLPLLLERGFEVVDCENMTFDEQVRMFSEAAYVVGPHGAAFTNILWSRPGARIFEVFEPAAVRRCYWSLCKTLGNRHGCGIAESVHNNDGGEPNIRVGKQEFEQALDKMFGKI
jgi:capsular polysaccharide biosynthesis protein